MIYEPRTITSWHQSLFNMNMKGRGGDSRLETSGWRGYVRRLDAEWKSFQGNLKKFGLISKEEK